MEQPLHINIQIQNFTRIRLLDLARYRSLGDYLRLSYLDSRQAGLLIMLALHTILNHVETEKTRQLLLILVDPRERGCSSDPFPIAGPHTIPRDL